MGIMQTPWTRQPQQAVGIDWSNPITRGLIIAENHSNPRFAAFNSPTQKVGPSYRGAGGVATRFVSSSSQYLKQSNTSLTNYPLTFLSVFQRASRPFDGVLIGIGAGTNRQILYVNQDNIACFSGAGGTTAQAVSASNNLGSFGPGDVRCAVGVVSAANSRSVYLDGALVGTNSTTVSTGASNTAVIGCYWNNDAPSTYFNGDIYLSLAWNRVLSDAEVQSISQNPWQIFKPLPRRIFVPVAAGGGTTAVTSDHNASYIITGSVAADASAAYAIRAAVTADATASYALRAAVAADASASYALRAAAQADQVAAYAIRAAVASDLAGSYAIQTAGTVTTGLDAVYALRSSVAGDISVGYQIAAAVQAEVAAAYAVRAAVQKDLAAGYAIQAGLSAVSADLIAAYAVDGSTTTRAPSGAGPSIILPGSTRPGSLQTSGRPPNLGGRRH